MADPWLSLDARVVLRGTSTILHGRLMSVDEDYTEQFVTVKLDDGRAFGFRRELDAHYWHPRSKTLRGVGYYWTIRPEPAEPEVSE